MTLESIHDMSRAQSMPKRLRQYPFRIHGHFNIIGLFFIGCSVQFGKITKNQLKIQIYFAKRIRKSGIDPEAINGQIQSYSNLLAVGADNIIALMFQTGYLTIESYDFRRHRYTLRFPNREVEIGFAENLLPLYAP